MTTILIVEKSGNIKETNVKTFVESELYKKAGFKSGDDFKLFTTWNVSLEDKKYNISLYGKTKGKATFENKYEFPPPVDTELFYGSCILVNFNDNNECVNLTENEWENIYEFLFGGFDDLEEYPDDEYEKNELLDESLALTKGGYVKDGFVIDSEESEEESEDEEEEDDEEEDEIIIKIPTKKHKKREPKVKPPKQTTETVFDCQSELSEESYFSE